MNPDIKARWVAALRSGDYDKGVGKLHTRSTGEDGVERHRFCCLGVLCELAIEEGVIERAPSEWQELAEGEPQPYNYGVKGSNIADYGDDSFVPDSVANWAGLTDNSPLVVDERHTCQGEGCRLTGHKVSLAYLNDERYVAFGPIANAIEQSDL